MRVTAFSRNRQTLLTVAVLLLLALAIPLFFGNISAATKDSLKIENFDVAYTSGQITASAIVKNVSSERIRLTSRLTIEKKGNYTIVGDSVEVGASKVLWSQNSKQFIIIEKEKGEKITFDFFLSSHLPSGEYNIILSIQNEFGVQLGGTNIKRTFSGDGSFLEFNQEDCKVFKNVKGKEAPFEAFIAPPFNPTEKPKAVCTVKNTSNASVTTKAILTTNVFRLFGFYLSNSDAILGDEIVFAPLESKVVTIALPTKSEPQVYEAGLQFVDPNNTSNRLSNVVPLRWTISGEAARLESVTMEGVRDSILGKQVNLKIGYFGSPDFFWNGADLGEKDKFKGSAFAGKLSVQVIDDKNGQVCGKTEESISADSDKKMTKDLSINVGSCENPTLSLKILDKNDKVLSSVNGILLAGVTTITTPIYMILIILVLVVVCLAAGLFILKRQIK